MHGVNLFSVLNMIPCVIPLAIATAVVKSGRYGRIGLLVACVLGVMGGFMNAWILGQLDRLESKVANTRWSPWYVGGLLLAPFALAVPSVFFYKWLTPVVCMLVVR